MPNHWHFAVRSDENGNIGKFFGRFTQKVTQRWHAAHHTIGSGHLFQGRFKSFMVQQDFYFIQLIKYIEANPLRAKMVKQADGWQWGSLYLRIHNPAIAKKLLKPWPIKIPGNYFKLVNQSSPEAELESIRHSVNRGRPFGSDTWVRKQVKKYDLEYTLRQPGRPKR